MRAWISVAVVVAVIATASGARANGAFPDAQQILLPKGNASQIILATNFGLVISDDAGKTWAWSCEQKTSTNGNLYQLGPAPMERLFALSQFGLVYSDDASCSWTASAGTLSSLLATDGFADPVAPSRVWAIASPVGSGAVGTGVYRSDDGGLTFGPSLYGDPRPGGLVSIESARADRDVVYVALYENLSCGGAQSPDAGSDAAAATCPSPRLLRSSDAGAHWDDPIDLEPALGKGTFRIIAVDPTEPRRLFLRFRPADAAGERLVITDDAGLTFRDAFRVKGRLTAFLRRSDGTILASGQEDAGPVGYRSPDGGATFMPWPGIPSLRALAERDGRIYAAADFIKDGYALGVSTNGGDSFTALMTFSQVGSIRACVQTLCEDPCDYQAGIGLWPPATCHPVPPIPPPLVRKTGCGCNAAGQDGTPDAWLFFAVWLAAWARRRHRRPAILRRS